VKLESGEMEALRSSAEQVRKAQEQLQL
jgi:hypothetical protein